METPLRLLVVVATLTVCSAGLAKRQAFYYGSANPAQLPLHRQYQHGAYPHIYQPLQVRSQMQQVPQYQQQVQQLQQPQYQQVQQYQQLQVPQYQRVILYNPGSGAASVYQQPAAPADVFPVPQGHVIVPLRAEGGEGGSTGGGATGGGFGGFNPTDYFTILQNYWQSLTGTGTNSQQQGNKPAESAGSAGTAGPTPAEAPTGSAEGSKKPEMPAAPAMPEAPAAPMAPAAPATAQRFLVVSQPHVISNPAVLPGANNGAVSTYLLLRNQPSPVFGYAAQVPQSIQPGLLRSPSVGVQPGVQFGVQPGVQQQSAGLRQPGQPGPMILVRTADNKYGLAPAPEPSRVLLSGDGMGIGAQDDVHVSGPGSQAVAFQRFLLSRQGQHAPGFYPTLNPSVIHSLADESISVESAAKDAGGSGSSTEQPAAASNSTDEEVVDSDNEPPVSIAQVKPSAIALAGPGGVAAAAPMGTALVGPGGMALAAPSATAVAGPSAQSAAVAAPSAHTAGHNADAYRKWLNKKKASIAMGDDADVPAGAPLVPEYLVHYGPSK